MTDFEPRAYLTKTDKIVFLVTVLIAIPLATLGFPFVMLGGTALVLLGLLFVGVRALIGLRKPRDVTAYEARAIRVTDKVSPPARVDHHYAVNKAGHRPNVVSPDEED